MQEELKKVTPVTAEPVDRNVTLCIRSQRIQLSGVWNWDMQSPAIYCSDVMSFPEEFIGTKGIIHPDDLSKLIGALALMEEKEVPRLDFRIITTYGEVRTITGQRVGIEESKESFAELLPGKEPWEEALQLLSAQKENDFLQLRRDLAEYTERLSGIGSWMISRETGQSWYSDNVFRIHGLAPQSVNAHANTFHPFIHKEDRAAVLEAFDKAFTELAPVHLEYRIVIADEEVRTVQQITRWMYNVKGESLFTGILRDITEERAFADELLKAQSHTLLHQQLLKFSEQQVTAGYWFMDLATRKTSYSDNYYRIYGFKQSILPNYNSFLNLVHGEDRDRVRDLIEKMYNEHALPETEYRIIRPDGKTRHIRQSGRLFISPNKNLMMIGVVQDVSVQKGLEKKIAELNEQITLNNAVMEMADSITETSFFVWMPDGYMQWSDGFYRMLGYRPGGVEPLQRFLYKNIHPNDLQTFRDAEALLLSNQQQADIVIHLVSKGGMRKVRMSFRKINYGRDAIIALVHDVTHQTKFDEQFRDNQLFAQLLEDSVNDMVIYTNTDHTILHWNQAAVEKTGIQKEDALYNNLFDILPKLNDEAFLGKIHLASRGTEGSAERVNGFYLRQSHDYHLWPLKTESGEVLGVLHVIQDISRQLELQQQLSERLNFIESLVESSVDRIVVLDRFMNYLYWNKKAEEYYAIKKERVLGKNILEIFPSFRNDPSYQQFRTVLKGETVYLPPVADDDQYFETYLIPIKNEDNDVSAVLWVVHDLSREYRLTQERTQTANLLQATLDASTEIVQVFEAVRNEEGKIVDFKYVLLNNEAEKWMPDALGKTLLQLQPGVVEEGIFNTFKNVVETGIPNQSERHYVHEQFNGWFHQSVVKLNDGVATTTTDITQRKLAEQEVWKLKDEVAQKATDKYKALFDSIDEGFAIQEVVTDENGNVTDVIWQEVNGAFELLTGMKNVVGKKASELLPHLEQAWLDALTQVYKTGKPLRNEDFTVDLNRWITYQYSRIGGAGSPLIAAVFNDITDRKLREQHQEFLLKFSDALRTETTADAVANKAIEILFDHLQVDRCYISEVFIEEGYSTVGPERIQPGVLPMTGVYQLSDYPETMRQLMTQPMVVSDSENDSRFSDSEKAMLALVPQRALLVAPLRKGPNQVIWALVVAMAKPRYWTDAERLLVEDIAERTWAAVERAKAEEQLKDFALLMERQVNLRTEELQQTNANLENFKRITDSAHDAIITLNREGKVDYWNEAAEILYGYSEEEVTGKELSQLIVPKHLYEQFEKERQLVFSKGEDLVDLETQRSTKDGKLLDVLVSIFPLKENGKIIGSCGITKDITARKKAEEEIRKNLTILQHTEQMAHTGSWEYEIATGEFSWSEGMYNLFGLPQQMKVRPETYLDFAVEEDRSVAKRIVNYLRKKQEPFEETIIIKKNNERRVLRVKGSLVRDEKGKLQKLIGVDIDITDIQKAEAQLKESRHWLEQTAKASPDSITIYDLQKKQPVYLNNCLAAWTGISNCDLVNMGVEGRLKLVHEDDRLKLLHFNERIASAKDGELVTMEYRIKSDDGKIHWLHNRSKPFLRDASGKVTHILSILQNVTEEVALREQLKQRTQFAESILDASIDRITVFDRHYRFVGWNKRCEQIHNKTRKEVIGKTIFEMFPGVEKHPEFMNAQEKSLRGEFVHVPVVKDSFTGDHLELFYIPLKNESGETYAVVNVMHDISDYVMSTQAMDVLNKKLEGKNTELEQKNEEITSFAFVASHDMKEPLRKIHTFSDWLMEQEAEHLSPKGKSMVDKINSSIHRMETLLDDILVLTKIHSDPHKEENIDPNAILKMVLNEMAEEIVVTQTLVRANELPLIQGNANQIFYLFKNLLSNAIKFQKPGSTPQINITGEIVKGEETGIAQPKEEYAKISVTDNGFGFDQRYAKKIFQVFQRLHGRQEFSGTGIGLAICKKVMENHNGLITVKSEVGQGSVFNCFFPLH